MTRRFFLKILGLVGGASAVGIKLATSQVVNTTYHLQIRRDDRIGPIFRYVDHHGNQIGDAFTVNDFKPFEPIPEDLFWSSKKTYIK